MKKCPMMERINRKQRPDSFASLGMHSMCSVS
jgi:hypothetical protein